MNVYDSSALIEILDKTFKGEKIYEKLKDNIINITSITIHEILVGAKNSEEFLYLKQIIENCNVLNFDAKSAEVSSIIERQLTKEVKKIRDADLFIAAICIKNKATLVTCDKDFKKIKELNLELF